METAGTDSTDRAAGTKRGGDPASSTAKKGSAAAGSTDIVAVGPVRSLAVGQQENAPTQRPQQAAAAEVAAVEQRRLRKEKEEAATAATAAAKAAAAAAAAAVEAAATAATAATAAQLDLNNNAGGFAYT